MLGKAQPRDTQQRELMASGTRPLGEVACKLGGASLRLGPDGETSPASSSSLPLLCSGQSGSPRLTARALPAPSLGPVAAAHLGKAQGGCVPCGASLLPRTSGISAKAKKGGLYPHSPSHPFSLAIFLKSWFSTFSLLMLMVGG